MCGIFGLWNTQERPVDINALLRSVSSIRHRGPDDEGYLLANLSQRRVISCAGAESDNPSNLPGIDSQLGQPFDLFFGYRRLSILDLSPLGHQPMPSPDRQRWIVFNGEIYNYVELRQELRNLGHEFISTSDTEVLLAGYSQWGAAVLRKLVGMFAFAILDMKKRALFLARDFFGIKPLYYAFNGSRFAFASETKALISLGDVFPKINPSALYTYLRYGITDNGASTLWNEIRHLPAAHYLEIKLDDPSPTICPQRYWDIDMQTRRALSPSDAAEQLRALFLENVRLHLRSDVPVGAALSGGIDSSSIVMAMRRHQPNQEIHTFSYVADDKTLNEDQWMELVNRDAGTIQHRTRITPADLVADLDDFIYSLDEPFSSTSMYAQYSVFRLTKQAGIKVMLDGQGADESLGGYNYFFSARLVSMLRNRRWLEAIAFLRNNWSRPYFGGPKLFYRAGAWLVPEKFHGVARSLIGEDFMPEWLDANWFEKQGVQPTQVYLWDQSKDPFKKLLYQSVMETSLPMLLRYEDRNSMAHSVESRVPFLTPDLINFIFSLPEEHIVDIQGNTKSVFRRAMQGLVPEPILQRRDKIGFSTPEKDWLTELSPWVDQVLNRNTSQSIPALKMDKAREEWRNVSAGRRPFNFRVWRWINLIYWSERHSVEY